MRFSWSVKELLIMQSLSVALFTCIFGRFVYNLNETMLKYQALGKKVVDKFTKLSKMSLAVDYFTADFLPFVIGKS